MSNLHFADVGRPSTTGNGRNKRDNRLVPLITVAALFLAVRGYDFVFAAALALTRVGAVGLDLSNESVKYAVRKAWPFVTFVLLVVMNNYTDMIMISFLRNSTEALLIGMAMAVVRSHDLHVLAALVFSTLLYLSLAALLRLFTHTDLVKLRVGAD